MRLFKWNFSSEDAFWMGTALESYVDVLLGRQACEAQVMELNRMIELKALKPSKMTRFERSCVRKQVKSVANDSTTLVAPFLFNALEAVESFVREKRAANSSWEVRALLDYIANDRKTCSDAP